MLVLALALVVLYTGPNAFLSPIAIVVVAAIGLAALLLQLRFRRDLASVRTPVGLNAVGLFCALLALGADFLHMSRAAVEAIALAAVLCFGVSGALILRTLRRRSRN